MFCMTAKDAMSLEARNLVVGVYRYPWSDSFQHDLRHIGRGCCSHGARFCREGLDRAERWTRIRSPLRSLSGVDAQSSNQSHYLIPSQLCGLLYRTSDLDSTVMCRRYWCRSERIADQASSSGHLCQSLAWLLISVTFTTQVKSVCLYGVNEIQSFCRIMNGT